MTIVIIGYYGFANAGDEAILTVMVGQLRGEHPDVRIIVGSGNPATTAQAHSVESVHWNNIAGLQRAIAGCDLVLIGGGGLFHDYWGADPNTLLTGRHWGIAYYAGCALLAALLHKPLMLYAVGVGPLVSEAGIGLTRATCDIASVISVRDPGSKELLESIGVAGDKIHVTADPAFAFRPDGSPGALEDSVSWAAGRSRPLLGVAARSWIIGVHPEFLERELATALDAFLEKTSGSVIFFPFQQIEGEQEDDRATAQRIRQKMRLQGRADIATDARSAGQIYNGLQQCDLVLGMRLHALIFAATARRPFVALSYDPKVDALETLMGIDAGVIPVKAIDAAVLTARLLAATAATTPSSGQLARLDGLRTASYRNTSLALDLLRHPAPQVDFGPELVDLLRRAIVTHLSDSESTAARMVEREAQVRAFEVENADLRSSVLALHPQGNHTDELVANANSAIVLLNREVAALRGRIAELGEEAAQRQAQSAELQERVVRSDLARTEALREIDRFRERIEGDLTTYRSQRAWKAMLLVRKAYSLLVRGSKGAFIGWVGKTALGRPGSLAEYDLQFPDILNYLPETFRAAAPPGRRTEPRGARHQPTQQNKYDVVILAIIDFDFRFQRPQQIAAELARRGHRVFWISPSRFVPPASPEIYKLAPLRDNLFEIHLRSSQPDVYNGELQPGHVAAMMDGLNALYADWDIAESATLVQLPFWRRLALRLREDQGSRLIYDCMDDWDTFENMGTFNVREEKSLVNECDLLVVSGAELASKFGKQNLDPILIRNGADFSFFAKASVNTLLAQVPQPVVGYFGAIADWIDLDLVEKVAVLRPTYSFVLIGEVFERDMSRLEALPNVFLLGSKRYEDIPAYLYNFDVCVIPFLLNQVTKATDPVKLYEYFSLGKPVVATDMAELQQCGDLIYIGRGADDFARKLDTALHEEPDTLRQRRIEFAKTNTWTTRVDRLDESVRKTYSSVSILIVTYNSQEYVRPCLESIARNTAYPNYEVIMVDNASTDGTVARVNECVATYPDLRFIALSENTGFAAGNNFATKEATGEYVIFLNVDTMVTPGWVHHLIRHVQNDPTIGLICPVTNFAGNEVKINVTYKDSEEMEQFACAIARANRGRTTDVGVVPLFCALMPRAVWEQVGELDDSFGMGMFEDDDLSMRVRAAGYRVAAAEDCFVHHFGQGSFSKIPSDAYNQLFEQNRKHYEEKWRVEWTPHRTRNGVRPPFEETRFRPENFVVHQLSK